MPVKKKQSEADLPVYLFHQGNNFEAYRFLGAHCMQENGEDGVKFRVWAPHAKSVSVVGDFNSWVVGSHPMARLEDSGIWETFIPGLKQYDVYKYCVTTASDELLFKSDPYAFHTETRPSNGSKIYDLSGYAWGDGEWMRTWQKRVEDAGGTMIEDGVICNNEPDFDALAACGALGEKAAE